MQRFAEELLPNPHTKLRDRIDLAGMTESHTRRLVRDLLKALQRALPAVREADRAYRALMRATAAQDTARTAERGPRNDR